MLRNTFQHSLLLKFHPALNIFTKLRFAALLLFYSVLPWESKMFCSSQWFIQEGSFKKKQFFHGWDQKIVLTCLRLETRSDKYYYWNFTMHSMSSSNLFLRPWCTSTPIFSKSKIFVHLSDSSMGDFLKRSTYSIEETKKVVLICVCLETGSNTLHFWNFTLHSISSSNCVLRPWCCSTPFCSEWARYSVHLSDSSKRDLLKRSNFFEDETKKSFNLSTLRNRFQHLLLLEFHHPLNFFIKFLLLPWCNCTPFYSKKARSSVHLKNSSTEDILKRSIFFTDETKKVVLTCLRLETRSYKHYYWNFIMHSISSSNFFLRPWCTSTPFFYKRARYLFISMIHPWGIIQKEALFS